ncbi:unnamed protein product, partial [Discosporangium mesarthrocarpum]
MPENPLPKVKVEEKEGAARTPGIVGGVGVHNVSQGRVDGGRRPPVAGFLSKAYQIFDSPQWPHICGWGNEGKTVVIRDTVEFARQVLPRFFKHSNIQSFVRQLNMYNFRKVVQDPTNGEFQHDIFQRGNQGMLHLIKRKQGAAVSH